MRSIAAITLFLFTVLGATASHATYTWTSHDHPGATDTYLYGIDGSNMVGYYEGGLKPAKSQKVAITSSR